MKQSLFGLTLPFVDRKTLLDLINAGHRCKIATLNPQLMLEAYRTPAFKETLNAMDYATIDGVGLSLLLKILGYKAPERYPGANLLTDLLVSGRNCYLLGGLDKQAETAKKYIENTCPSARIVGAESGGKIDQKQSPDPAILARINESRATVLLVGFGAPKQEAWIGASFSQLPSIQVAVGIGGAFGFFGQKSRAPQSWQYLGIEWLYRGLHEKGHWRRVWQAVVLFPCTAILWQLQQVLSQHK